MCVQVVSLVAAYLDVPLRYPLRLRASRSYIQDPAPPFDFTAADLGPVVSPSAPQSGQKSPVEFPLFSEGQELTRSAYAVFLLNKVSWLNCCMFVNLNSGALEVTCHVS